MDSFTLAPRLAAGRDVSASRCISRPRIALLGDFTSAEFANVHALLLATADCSDRASPAEALGDAAAEDDLELVVVAQAWPGQFGGTWVDRLRYTSPLVKVVVVLGTLSAGETRTGKPLQADMRVFWHAFPMWWDRQVRLCRMGRTAAWSHFGAAEQATPTGGWWDCQSVASRGLAVIAAADRQSADAIALASAAGGWASVWVRPPGQLPTLCRPAVLVYDGGALDAPELVALQQLRHHYGRVPVIVLCDLPAADRVAAAHEHGVSWVLGKPFQVCDLLWALRQASERQNDSATE